MAFPSWLRLCAAMIFMAGLLGLSDGCHHGAGAATGTVSLSGYITFNRTPVLYNAAGQPTGLGATPVTYPARGVVVRAFQLDYDVDQNGKSIQVWHMAATTSTDINGYYSFTNSVYGGYATFVEVDSVFQQATGHQSIVQVIADANGLSSTVPEPQRPIYVFREDVGGTVVTSPVASDPTQPFPASGQSNVAVISASISPLNIILGSTDNWQITVPNWYVPGTNPAYPLAQAPPTGSVSLGSEVLGILDSAYLFSFWYGDPTPSQVAGGALDLHYYPGRTESPVRSYVVYNPSLTPLAWDGTKFHYFATLAGGPVVDDGWDQGVIFPMLARNFLFGQGKTSLFPTGQSSTLSEAPDLAVVDGMADAMAATLLTTPFLTDITSSTPLTPRDIRVIPAQPGIGSPGTLAAVAWQLSLVGNYITPPGNYATWSYPWSTGNPTGLTYPPVMATLFDLSYPYTQYLGANGTVTESIDTSSIFAQVGRLQDAQDGQPENLAPLFPNLTLLTLLSPYNISWPQTPQTWPYIAADWDSTTNPTPGPLLATLPSFTLSMANAQPVPNQALANPAYTGPATIYPNVSQGEVAYAKLSLFLDRAFIMGISTNPTLPPGAILEVAVDPAITPPSASYLQPQGPFLFTASNMAPVAFTLLGNPPDYTNPIWHYFRFRILSPTAVQPDVQVTVTLQ